jgi:hypothetical protein
VNGETKVLYDVRTEGAPVGRTVASGVGGVLVGVLLLAIAWKRPERAARLFGLFWVAAWGGLSALTVHGIAARHRDAQRWVGTRSVEVVEGVVTDLVPATSNDQGIETFRIGGRAFRIEDGQTKRPGLNRSFVRGGPIRGGSTVRLTVHGESILVVEQLAPPPASNPGP